MTSFCLLKSTFSRSTMDCLNYGFNRMFKSMILCNSMTHVCVCGKKTWKCDSLSSLLAFCLTINLGLRFGLIFLLLFFEPRSRL